MKCTACGSEALIEGTTITSSDGAVFSFYPKDTPSLKRIFGIGGRAIHAYGCIRCHNLQFAVGFTEKDSERYQQFDGEQPNVLERINSDPKKLKD